MLTTLLRKLRYPQGGDATTIAQYFQNLATDVDTVMPGGEAGFAGRYTQAGPVSTSGWVTTSGLTSTFTLLSARKMLIILDLQGTSDAAGTIVGARILNQTNGYWKGKTITIPTTNFGMALTIITRQALPAGTYTIVGQQAWFGGPGGAYFTADPQELMLFDMGPA